MERLPRELAVDILSRLPVSSLYRVKFVDKLWNSLAKDPLLPIMHKAFHKNPYLVLHSDQLLHEDHLYLIESNSQRHFETSPLKLDSPIKSVMPHFDIIGSCNGLLCLSGYRSPDTLHIHNPLTNETVQLPPTTKNFFNQRVVLAFGFSPTTKEFKVVRIVYSLPPRRRFTFGNTGRGNSDTSIYTLGTYSWRSQGKAPYCVDSFSTSAFVNGNLHWLTLGRRYREDQDIVSFNLATESFEEVPGPSCDSLKRSTYTLVELGGCLSAFANTSRSGQVEVWVMKDYNVRESWSKVYIIRSYSPVQFNIDKALSDRMRVRKSWNSTVRVVCLWRNGEILLEYGNQALVSYDPIKDVFNDLSFDDLPDCFKSVALMGSLVSFKGGIEMRENE